MLILVAACRQPCQRSEHTHPRCEA